ncbi:MAG TPA: QueT transporter family protein [Firmicutes bacterium]|nr:QueT transporter family protein [Bacillota bacterium]
MKTERIVRGAAIAGLYVALVYIFQPISFGQIQLRIAEALTVLPILYVEAVPALFVGCLLANLLGPVGPWDIIGGSLVTLLAAIGTYRFRNSILAYLSPVILNGLLVSLYLTWIIEKLPYWVTAISISVSEAIVVFGLGMPLINYLKGRAGKGKS